MKKITEKDVLNILNEVSDQVDWEHETHLLSDRVIDSLMLVSAISMLSDAYDVEFDFDLVNPDNMDSLKAITATMQQLL